MSNLIQIDRVLCLPEIEISALREGRVIAVLPQVSVQKGWIFGLYPYNASNNSSFHRIHLWAKCEYCTMIHNSEQLENLAHSTVWTKMEWQNFLQQRQHLFFAHLRVYQLPQPLSVAETLVSADKFGKFLSLPALYLPETKLPVTVDEVLPILSDAAFLKRQDWLKAGKFSPYLELEELSSQLAQLSNPNAQQFQQDIKVFLGHLNYYEPPVNPDLDWIKTIAATGNSSDGDTFEKLVRRSLIKLGFVNSNSNPQASLDPNGCGGAGGLDFYCQEPYQVVGECKATQTESVPDSTPAQLIKLGYKHLQQEYNNCIKIIMAAGQLNSHAKQTANGNQMNVIRPETLQRLVELKAKHPGSIDLIELKPYLENPPFGEEADAKIDAYINEVWQRLRTRENIVQAVKYLDEMEPDQTQFEVKEIRVQYKNKLANQNDNLDNQAVYEILLELSSPLVGCVGRVAATGIDSDRFYFLRELQVD